jgi:SAM-dependent methyltransferase
MWRDGLSGYARRAALYDVEYRESRDVAFWLSQIRDGEDAVLEIPCGVGRLTFELARKAREVTAVDIEPQMVEILRCRVAERELTGRVHVRVGDLTSLSLGREFDLIVVPREALQLLPPADAAQALSRLVEHLLPGGRLIVDLATFADGCSGDPDYFDTEAVGDEWMPEWTRDLNDGRRLSRSLRIRSMADRMHVAFRYQIVDDDGGSTAFADEIVLYRYDATSLSRLVPADVDVRLLCDEDHELYECEPQARLIAVIRATGEDARASPE